MLFLLRQGRGKVNSTYFHGQIHHECVSKYGANFVFICQRCSLSHSDGYIIYCTIVQDKCAYIEMWTKACTMAELQTLAHDLCPCELSSQLAGSDSFPHP